MRLNNHIAGLALICVGLAGCKTTSSASSGFETGCQLAVSPDRRAIAFLTETALVRRMGGEDLRLPFADYACLRKGKTTDKLSLSGDGRFAVVLGEEAQGFNLHESVPFEATVCCLVDFEKREAKDLNSLVPEAKLADGVRHRQILMSPRRPLMLAWGATDDGVQVIDSAAPRAARIQLRATQECAFVDSGKVAVMACPGFAQLDSGAYEHFVEVTGIDLGQWPPSLSGTKRIPVPAKLNGVALSPDGALVAYWGYGFGELGDYHDLFGVVERDTGERRFEHRETRYGYVTSLEFSPDGRNLLLGERLVDGGERGEKIGTNERGRVARLDLAGKRMGSSSVAKPPRRVFWMKAGVLCDLGCRAISLEAF